MKNSHTPGPWVIIETANMRNKDLNSYLLCNKSPYAHAIIKSVSNQSDLALIQSAPEMLSMLQDLIDCQAVHRDYIDDINNLIKKAKGE